MAHTPGPWTLEPNPYADGTPYYWIKGGNGYLNSTENPEGFSMSGIVSDTDAKLIAAAPSLLEALKSLRAFASGLGLNGGMTFEAWTAAYEPFRIADAAIAKAEGREA